MISRRPTSRLCSGFRLRELYCEKRHGDDRMNHVMKIGFGVALSFMTLAPAAAGRRFQALQQPADCLQPRPGSGQAQHGDLQVLCLRLQRQDLGIFPLPGLARADAGQQGGHQRAGRRRLHQEARIFDADSSYSFDATETEAPNTNSFFGPGGYAVWASDNNAPKVRGCIIISSGLGSDISKCIDMKFE